MLKTLLHKPTIVRRSLASIAQLTRNASTAKASPTNKGNNSSFQREPIRPFPQTATRQVPATISKPPYAATGHVPISPTHDQILIHDKKSIDRMRNAAQLARDALDLACTFAEPGVSTDDIDNFVHEFIIANRAYPSPLNYAGFPGSMCSSINEVICHGIPDTRSLQRGDVVSFDVRYENGSYSGLQEVWFVFSSCLLFFIPTGSCFLNGVHGDNCATVIVGDSQLEDTAGMDWRGVPYRSKFESEDEQAHFEEARRLVQTTYDSLYAAIEMCRPGGCLTDIGAAIQHVADSAGYSSVRKYRGHGISSEFHCAPFVKHYKNSDKCKLRPGMIFTIEPMLVQGSSDCFEWDDYWTVSTVDMTLSAQFEHTVLITDTGVEILTLPRDSKSR